MFISTLKILFDCEIHICGFAEEQEHSFKWKAVRMILFETGAAIKLKAVDFHLNIYKYGTYIALCSKDTVIVPTLQIFLLPDISPPKTST
jgi:hypothetical protein